MQISGRMSRMAFLGVEEDKFRAAVDAATDGLAITDSDGCYVYLNQAHIDMFGIPAADLIGQSWRTIYTDEEAARLERDAIPVVIQQGSWRGEASGRHQDGSTVHQEIVLTLHPTGGLICATRDVSKRREQERRARLLEARLRIAERNEVLFSLHNSLAHDFGNLIAAIDGFARLIHQAPSAIDLNRARIDLILKATEQAFELIRSTAPDERHSTVTASVDLPALIHTTLGIANSLKADAISISSLFEVDHAEAMANEVLASRSFLNVVKNAIEAVSGSGAIAVRLQQRASPRIPGATVKTLGPALAAFRWVVEIEDNGEGMSPERLEAILTQGYTSKRGSAGRGLGLESVVALAETGLVGVEIQSAEGVGTRFVFRFVDADAEWTEELLETSTVSGQRTTKPRVFVVDDNELVASMLMQTLVASGFEATYALSGADALDSNVSAFDAVVTDFRMFGMDGQELARRLKALRADLPIIIYSGQGGHIAHSPLFTAVLTKPVDPAELVNAVRSAVAAEE
jgi:PAS domain S-box-containing protein